MGILHVGFTGTQRGMTDIQKNALEKILRRIVKNSLKIGDSVVFHHGDCVGADMQAHSIARQLRIDVIIHPPNSTEKQAKCTDYLQKRKAKPYLDRNKDIVDECEILIAAPKECSNVLRSGTWSTVRYARKRELSIVIIIHDDIKQDIIHVNSSLP